MNFSSINRKVPLHLSGKGFLWKSLSHGCFHDCQEQWTMVQWKHLIPAPVDQVSVSDCLSKCLRSTCRKIKSGISVTNETMYSSYVYVWHQRPAVASITWDIWKPLILMSTYFTMVAYYTNTFIKFTKHHICQAKCATIFFMCEKDIWCDIYVICKLFYYD